MMPLPIIRSASGLTLNFRTSIPRQQPLSRLLSCSYSASATSRHDRPFRMAVVGSGPAGFYTAYRVMSLIDRAKVDMYEALPVPFGLVRFGVAPDHPEVKVSSFSFLSFSPPISQTLPFPTYRLHIVSWIEYPMSKFAPLEDLVYSLRHRIVKTSSLRSLPLPTSHSLATSLLATNHSIQTANQFP